MPAAARIQDKTSHGGELQGAGVKSVKIAGQAAAVANDPRTTYNCPVKANPPHLPSTILGGSSSVTIGGSPAALVGDKTTCGAQIIVSGVPTVTIGA